MSYQRSGAKKILAPRFPPPLAKLRPYQAHTLESIIRFYEKALKQASRSGGARAAGERALPFCRPCCCLPTAAGKTIIFLSLAQRVLEEWGWRTLVVVPDKNLVRQIVRNGEKYFPALRCGEFKVARHRLEDYDLVVSTCAGLGPKRRSQIAKDFYKLVVWDECHYLPARTFHSAFKYLSGAEISVGFSATIKRGDQVVVVNNSSDEYFTHLVSYYNLSQLTEAGYVVPMRGIFVSTETSLAGVGKMGGDYNKRQLAGAVNNPIRNRMAVEAWLKYCKPEKDKRGRPTVCFCVNVNHAKAVAECFEKAGVSARVVWNKMSGEEYDRAMEDYESGRVEVLVNVRMFVHGWDAPWTSCVMILRPATPAAMCVLAPQMIGRGVRLSPETGKTDLLVIELLDKDRVSASDEVRDAGNVRRGLRSGVAVGGRLRVFRSMVQAAMGSDCDFEDEGVPLHLQARAHEQHRAWCERMEAIERARGGGGDFFFDVVGRITQSSRFTWIPLGTSSLFMFLDAGDFIELYERDEFHYDVRIVFRGKLAERREFSIRREALSFANGWLRRNFTGYDEGGVSDMDASMQWRSEKPLALHVGQAHALTGIPFAELEKLTMGQVCDIITTVRALEMEPSMMSATESEAKPLWVDEAVQMGLSFV